MKSRNMLQSFNYAVQGVVKAIKTERNLKIHIVAAIGVLIASKYFNVSYFEFLTIILICTMVIFAELINTAIEAVVDMVCGEKFNSLAKLAKDVAAGAVFICSVSAVAIGYIIFHDKFDNVLKYKHYLLSEVPSHVSVICIFIAFFLSITIKVLKGKTNSLLHGGMPSGHCAVAFAAATSILFITEEIFVIMLSFALALLVAQSRYEGKIHSFIEIVLGSALGFFIVLLMFQTTR